MSVLNECENGSIEDHSLVRSNHTAVFKESQEENCFIDSLIDLAVNDEKAIAAHNPQLHCNSHVLTDENMKAATNAVCNISSTLQSITEVSSDKLLEQQDEVISPMTVYNGKEGTSNINGCQLLPLSLNKDIENVFEQSICHIQSGTSSEVSSDSDQEFSKQQMLEELDEMKNVVCEQNLKIKM